MRLAWVLPVIVAGSDISTHGHYINMSSTQYTQVACGFYTLSDGQVWATQDFQ